MDDAVVFSTSVAVAATVAIPAIIAAVTCNIGTDVEDDVDSVVVGFGLGVAAALVVTVVDVVEVLLNRRHVRDVNRLDTNGAMVGVLWKRPRGAVAVACLAIEMVTRLMAMMFCCCWNEYRMIYTNLCVVSKIKQEQKCSVLKYM